MIVKSGGGYKVTSEEGKNLSKGGLSMEAAKHRLQQVEFFKHKGKKRGRPKKNRPPVKGMY